MPSAPRRSALMRASILFACDVCTLLAIWLCGCVLLLSMASSAFGISALGAPTTISEQRLRKSVCLVVIGLVVVSSARQVTSIACANASLPGVMAFGLA